MYILRNNLKVTENGIYFLSERQEIYTRVALYTVHLLQWLKPHTTSLHQSACTCFQTQTHTANRRHLSHVGSVINKAHQMVCLEYNCVQ